MAEQKTFMELFIDERKRQGLSQVQVADRCDVSISTINKSEAMRKTRQPKIETFAEMCRGIGFTIIMIPTPQNIKPQVVKEKVIVKVERKVDYDNWEEKS